MRQLIFAAFVAAGALFFAACAQSSKDNSIAYFDPGAFDASSDSVWMADSSWRGLPAGSKVAITEFVVEYVTSTKGGGGADDILGMGRKKTAFSERCKEQLPTTLYNEFVSALQAEGLVVVPMANITRDPAMRGWELQPQSGTDSDVSDSEIQTYHVRGLPVAPTATGIFNSDDVAHAEVQTVVDNGGAAALHVQIRVGIDGDAHAFLDSGSMIRIGYSPEQASAGWPIAHNFYRMKQNSALMSGQRVRDDYPVIVNQEFKALEGDIYTINSAAFQQAMQRIYPGFIRLAAQELKQ